MTTPPPLLIATILGLIHEIWISLLLISQLQQMYTDRTTYELIRRTPPLMVSRLRLRLRLRLRVWLWVWVWFRLWFVGVIVGAAGSGLDRTPV